MNFNTYTIYNGITIINIERKLANKKYKTRKLYEKKNMCIVNNIKRNMK